MELPRWEYGEGAVSMSMPQGLPPGLAQQLMGGQGQSQDEYDQGGSPLQVLQECIQSLPGVIQALPDPKDTQDAVRALLLLTGVQSRLMAKPGG